MIQVRQIKPAQLAVGCTVIISVFTYTCKHAPTHKEMQKTVALKMREWKKREWKYRHDFAGVENAGVEVIELQQQDNL